MSAKSRKRSMANDHSDQRSNENVDFEIDYGSKTTCLDTLRFSAHSTLTRDQNGVAKNVHGTRDSDVFPERRAAVVP